MKREWMPLLMLGCVLALPRCDRTTCPGEAESLAVHKLDLSLDSIALPACDDPRRQAVPAPVARWEPVAYRPWRHIVIHHSAGPSGNSELFDKWHRARGFDSLGYHFVITNGDGGPDGAIEVGQRWLIQKWGAHTGNTPDNELNNFGIGVCLVGDFNRTRPTPSQLASLRKLVSFLAQRYDVPPARVIGHRDAPGAVTDCPGDKLWKHIHGPLRGQLARELSGQRRPEGPAEFGRG